MQNLPAWVKANLLRILRHRDLEGVPGFCQSDLLIKVFAADRPSNLCMQFEGWNLRLFIHLLLLDRKGAHVSFRVKAKGDLQLRIARRVNPLVKQLLQRPASMLLQHALKVMGLHNLITKSLQVFRHRLPKQGIADFMAQGVQPTGSARIEMAVVHLP